MDTAGVKIDRKAEYISNGHFNGLCVKYPTIEVY